MHLITKDQVDRARQYTGPDLSDFDGDVIGEDNLGNIEFKDPVKISGDLKFGLKTWPVFGGNVKARKIISPDFSCAGNIECETLETTEGSIKCVGSVDAFHSIRSKSCIIARDGLTAGPGGISAVLIKSTQCGVYSGASILCEASIVVARSIVAVENIIAGTSIKAGWSIDAGWGIEAECIEATSTIVVGKVIRYRSRTKS